MDKDALTNASGFLSPPSSSSSKSNVVYSTKATSTPLPPSVTRLWRAAAQRNLRNRWSTLAQCRKDWSTYMENGFRIANSLLNNYLCQRNSYKRDFGVVSDVPDIRINNCHKYYKLQLHDRNKLLDCYKDMVEIVVKMFQAAALMRCFSKGIGSPLVKFSFDSNEDGDNDSGDGGGIKVFRFLSISSFEKLAAEQDEMFALELNLKRFLVVEFLSIKCEDVELVGPCWSAELYPGEFDDLHICGLYSKQCNKLKGPKLKEEDEMDVPVKRISHQPDLNVLEMYQTVWITDVNIDKSRLEEIFAIAEEEIQVNLLRT